jgi:hypothetical protein
MVGGGGREVVGEMGRGKGEVWKEVATAAKGRERVCISLST